MFNGINNQTLSIFPPAKIATKLPLLLENPYRDEDFMFPLLSLDQSRGLQEQFEDHILQQFLFDSSCIDYPISFNGYQHVLSNEFGENFHSTIFSSFAALEVCNELKTELVEIIEGKILHIGT